MNLYEWEGKNLFQKHGIATPKSILVRRGDDVALAYINLGELDVVVKAQILSGKRGKNNGILFCENGQAVESAVKKLFESTIAGQYVSSVFLEEKLSVAEERYLSITYDTGKRQPLLMYSRSGGMDIESVSEEKIEKIWLDVREEKCDLPHIPFAQELWECFLKEDARLVEINPIIKTKDGQFIAGDAKVALDDDAVFRHEEWRDYEPRTMLGRLPTEREKDVRSIDEGRDYYRGTAGKYIELDGDVAVLFSGGGASIANMDALMKAGCRPANYSEYSGNPPREKVYRLAKIVLSKPGLKGLWIAGGVANFTNVAETFQGIADALAELKPTYPIVVRRAGPFEKEGMALMKQCAEENNLTMKLFGKETSMSETAGILADMIKAQPVVATH
ncbi:MAG: ATP citrate lyase citrate-binding domain-containing protein [bacterium]|nr:ATP citrate lyase citrate-binding domain-containing protein [bacterium]